MGIFSRKQDDDQDYAQDGYYDEPAQQDQSAPLPAPSVDGVLPPGVTPAPAPPSHNLSSQTPPVADPATDSPPVDDTAGEYIEASPPMQQPAQDWNQPAADNTLADELALEPAYEEAAAPAPAQEEQPAQTQEPISEPAPETTADTSLPPEPSTDEASPTAESEPADSEATADAVPVNVAGSDTGDLSDIKRQALTQLSSLAGHLEQSPEEKFHTTMMLVQATDDASLIKTAYEAAQAITDEKTRAQALLDVVNEINYFAQKENK